MKRIFLLGLGVVVLLVLGSIVAIGLNPAGFVRCFVGKSNDASQSVQADEQTQALISQPTPEQGNSSGSDTGAPIVFGVVVVLVALLYFLPAIVGKSKRNFSAIFILNLFAGWSFIGWVIALVWACMCEPATSLQSLPDNQEPSAEIRS
jgi:hypothetical protein